MNDVPNLIGGREVTGDWEILPFFLLRAPLNENIILCHRGKGVSRRCPKIESCDT